MSNLRSRIARVERTLGGPTRGCPLCGSILDPCRIQPRPLHVRDESQIPQPCLECGIRRDAHGRAVSKFLIIDCDLPHIAPAGSSASP